MPISAVDLSKPANQQSVKIVGGSNTRTIQPTTGGVHISPVNLSVAQQNSNRPGSAYLSSPAPTPVSSAPPVITPPKQNVFQKVQGAAQNVQHFLTTPIGEQLSPTSPTRKFIEDRQASVKNLFDDLSAQRKKVNAGVTEAFTYPFGKPAGETVLTPVGHEADGKVPEIKGAFQDPTRPYDQSMLAAQNRVFGEAGASLVKGWTSHIINPEVKAPENGVDWVIQNAFEGAGKLAQIMEIQKGAGQVIGTAKTFNQAGEVAQEGAGLLGKSDLLGHITTRFPSLARFIPSALQNTAAFNIYSQMNPEQKNRMHQIEMDTLMGVGSAGTAGARKLVAVPASFTLGAGMTKLDGGSNKEAFVNGMFMVGMDLLGRLGETKAVIEKNGADPILKEQAINKLNTYLDEPLPKNATYEEATAARRDLIKNGKYVNPSSPDATPEQIKTATEINNAINMLKEKMGVVPAESSSGKPAETQPPVEQNKDIHVFTPEEMKVQTQTTDLQGTPAAERLDTIIATAQQVGKDIQIDLSGEKGIPIGTPEGNKIGVTLVDKKAEVAPVTQTPSAPESVPTSQSEPKKNEVQTTQTSSEPAKPTDQQTQVPSKEIATPTSEPVTAPTQAQSTEPTKVTPAEVQQSADRVTQGESPVVKNPTTDQIPHKEGYSRLQERLEEQLLNSNGDKYNWNDTNKTYDKVSLKEDAQKAVDLLQNDPQKAMRIAQGYDAATLSDPLEFNVANAVALKAFQEGNAALGTKVMNRLSQTATRFGQNIVSLRGNFNDNSPQNFMRQVIDARMEKLGKSIATDASKAVGKPRSAKTRAVEKIDREVEKLQKIMKKERMKIDFAQDILDQLTCK